MENSITYQDSWLPLGDITSLEGINQVHCDTRDFHCLLRTDPLDARDGKHREITRNSHNSDFQMPENALIPFLAKIKQISGGKGEWRMLDFKGVNTGNWLKYIRCYRLKNGNFIICNRDNEPIEWEKCTEETLIKEHLHFSED